MGLLNMNSTDYYSEFAREGGRVGWGSPRTKSGGGQGGVARCVR
ncbi:hypothetical protein ABZ690_36125 [Streptomyces sp. NPDC006967]|nr:hypothetical protein [Streptomyces sp. SM1]